MRHFLIGTLALLTIATVNAPSDVVRDRTSSMADFARAITTQNPRPAFTFQGFANSRDVIIIGGVMGVTYYFCKEQKSEFCSDNEGILIVSGSETGKVPDMLKLLDEAIKNDEMVIVTFSSADQIFGVFEILDVKLLDSSI